MHKGNYVKFTMEEEQRIKDDYLTVPMKRLAKDLGTSFARIKRYLIRNNLHIPKEVIDGMIKDINKSRNRVESWNPSELNETPLPPCHTGFQCVGYGDKGFFLSFNMRAWDWFLGASFNIASYDILGHLLGLITGHKYLGLMATGHCVHLYDNQIEGSKELLKRDPKEKPNCELVISDKVKDLCRNYDGNVDKIFDNMNIEDFSLKNYECFPKISVKMLAPKKV